MKGYPEHLAVKKDVENLIKDFPEFADRIKQDLQRIIDEPDTVTAATTLIDTKDESKGYNTKEIPNPNPRWKQMGFVSKKEVDLLAKATMNYRALLRPRTPTER